MGTSSHCYEYLFMMPKLIAAWEHLLEFGEGFLGETLLEFRGGRCGGILMDMEEV